MTGKRARRTPATRLRRPPLLWTAGAVAAVVLVLGTDGTLSAWTSAVLSNGTNTAATAQAVILKETLGATTCASSDAPAANSFSCTTINTYGGTATPLSPGGSQTVDVTFSDVGASAATTFVVTPGTCSQSPTAGSGSPAVANVCTNGELTVALSCSPGSTYASGSAWSDLAYAAGAPPTAAKTHTATGSELNAGASWTCRTTVALSGSASVLDQGVTVTQPITWTLNK